MDGDSTFSQVDLCRTEVRVLLLSAKVQKRKSGVHKEQS